MGMPLKRGPPLPGLVLAVHRLDASITEGRCLAPGFREWLCSSTVADLRVAYAHALWRPQAMCEHATPQAIMIMALAAEAGDSRLSAWHRAEGPVCWASRLLRHMLNLW